MMPLRMLLEFLVCAFGAANEAALETDSALERGVEHCEHAGLVALAPPARHKP